MDRFQSLRCLNDCIDLPYMMGSLASGATNSLVAKIGTKDSATSCWVYRKNNSAISSQIFIPKEAFEPYNHLELTQPHHIDLTNFCHICLLCLLNLYFYLYLFIVFVSVILSYLDGSGWTPLTQPHALDFYQFYQFNLQMSYP